jgi:hypothetical protein
VDDGGIAMFFELLLDASDVLDREFQQSRSFGLCSFAIKDRLHHFKNVTFSLTHLHTVPVLYLDHRASPRPERGGHFYRVNTGHF